MRAGLLLFCLVPCSAQAAGALVGALTSTTPPRLERVTVNFDIRSGTVATTLEVIVRGEGRVAWILPVPSRAITTSVADDVLARLQAATEPELQLAPEAPCGAASTTSGGGCACGEPAPLPQGQGPPGQRSPRPPRLAPKPALQTWQLTRLSDTSPDALRMWLAAHGYRGRPELDQLREPWLRGDDLLIVEATLSGAHRLVLQITPFELQLPLELVGDAAAVPLPVLVFLRGPQTYVTLSGVPVPARPGALFVDRDGASNYFAWIARSATESEGRWWVTERLGPDPLGEGMVSRFFTLPAPHHLRRAVFGVHPIQDQRVSGLIDLTERRSLYACDQLLEDQEPGPCGFVYCGQGAICSIFEASPVCWCSNDQRAHRGVLPDGQPYVTCLPAKPSLDALCQGASCGAGQCVSDRERAACVCDPGRGAGLGDDGPSCVDAPQTPTYGPGGGVEAVPDPTASLGLTGLLMVGWLGWRTRRNKSGRHRV